MELENNHFVRKATLLNLQGGQDSALISARGKSKKSAEAKGNLDMRVISLFSQRPYYTMSSKKLSTYQPYLCLGNLCPSSWS